MSSEWDAYWSRPSLKRRVIELARKYYFCRVVCSMVAKMAGRTILEAGTGSGIYLRYLKAKGFTVYGIDLSIESVKKAKQQCHNIVQGNIFQLPFKDNSIDIIFNQGVMEHFTDEEWNRILKEFSRVSKRLVVIVPGNLSLWRIYDPIGDDDEKRFISPQKLNDLLSRHYSHCSAYQVPLMGFLSVVGYGEKDGEKN